MSRLIKILIILVIGHWSLVIGQGYAQETKEPIVVNGDNVEYSTDSKEVIAKGNVVVIYKGTKLTCDRITVNTQSKEAVADGNVRIEDEKGTIEAETAIYDFTRRSGTIMKAKLKSPPYYGKGDSIERISENQFNIKNGYITTCDLDEPHYRISAKHIEVYPEDKIRIKNTTVSAGKTPVLYLPQYTHSLKDPFMHVRLIPGKSSDWGPYMLSAWRYNLAENLNGRVYFDYRQRLGVAEGFGLNYTTEDYGRGDYKYYYTQERVRRLPQDSPAEFQRYLIRWRHMWDIAPKTKATLEYNKLYDAKRAVLGTTYNFLKDYFKREYEKDSQPKTYFTLNRVFESASLNLLIQKRINPWYTHYDKVPDEKLPEISFDLPSYYLGRIPLYFKNQTQFANLANRDATSSNLDDDVVRFDTYNQFSLPLKLSILNLAPYIGIRETFYTKDKNDKSLDPRTTFYSGIELSTKFSRLFDLKTNLWRMNINGLRHIITPTIKYAYNHSPTVPRDRLTIFDSIDTIEATKELTLELVNKLQTKQEERTVDLAIFKTSTEYNLARQEEVGKGFSDILFDLELLPHAWLRIESDAAYDPGQNGFKNINLDISAELGKDRSFGLGQRYERKGGKELTSEFNWRFNPKWKFRMYERYQFASVREKGLKEQEYVVSRDLHCWEIDLGYNISREHGNTIWVMFRLKAFPEMGIDFNQSYRSPKSD